MDQPPPSGNPQLSAHLDQNRFVGRTRVAYFPMEIAISPTALRRLGGDDALNMTRFALNLSGYINGVAA